MAGTSCVHSTSLLFCTRLYPDFGYFNLTRLTDQYVASIALSTSRHRIRCSSVVLTEVCYYTALLYYDYLLTLGREWRLLWKWNSLRQWGSILFFLNRYCGIIGHTPIFVEIFASQDSAFCRHMHAYHQALAALMQTIIAGMSFTTSGGFAENQLTTRQRPSSQGLMLCTIRAAWCFSD